MSRKKRKRHTTKPKNSPGPEWLPANPFLKDYICERLEKVECGEIKRLMIFLPPWHSKLMTVSETFPSYFIGKEEAESITYREKIWGEWQNTLLTRLHPDAAVIIILTRWHEDDLAS